MKKIVTLLLIALAMVGCTTKREYILFSDTNISKPHAPKSVLKVKHSRYEYKIRPHDRISINMYNHPELGTTSVQSQKQDVSGILVNSRGYVRLPLIKSIHIAGLTQTAAQRKIERAYKAYLEDAELYLEVLNKRAYILGEVHKPGPVRLFNEKVTLLQLLAQAGDLTSSANRQAIVIMKSRNNKIHTQTIDLTGVNSLKYANLMIYPNDIVYVAPSDVSSINVGLNEASSLLGFVGKVTQPIVSVKYLTD